MIDSKLKFVIVKRIITYSFTVFCYLLFKMIITDVSDINSWFCSDSIQIGLFIASLLIWFFLYGHVENNNEKDSESSIFSYGLENDGLNLTKFSEYVDNMSILLGIVFCFIFELINSWICK